MRRGKDDKEWQDLKERIFKRDSGCCRLLSILSLKESYTIKKYASFEKQSNMLGILDPAHIFPVSLYPHLIYEDLNVILLNRFAHNLLENHSSPLTGERLGEGEYAQFFVRILGGKNFATLASWAKDPEQYKQEKENGTDSYISK